MSKTFDKSHYSTLIIGAGLQGLACARTFLRLDPASDLLILDANQSIGGVWAKERLYTGLRTNNQVGSFEYTDFPVLEADLDPKHGLKPESHLPGEAVHEYLVKFAKKEGLLKYIKLGCKIHWAQETEHSASKTGWKLEVHVSDATEILTCDVLIFAIGTCNTPKKISLRGQSEFSRPIVNFADLGTTGNKLAHDPNVHNITVYGAGKSAFDSVYLFATAGKQVTWVVRKSGKGARYMAPSFINMGPFRKWLEGLLVTRPLTWFSPCVFGSEDGFGWIRGLLHNTWAGNQIVQTFFKKMTGDTISQSGIDSQDPRMKPLVPRESLFWHATQCGILNYPTNFWDLMRSTKIEVVEQDIDRLGVDGTIHFADGSSTQTDAILAAAGWELKPSVQLFPEEKHAEWGIPSASYSPQQNVTWAARHQRADAELLARFPMLATSSALNVKEYNDNKMNHPTPYRLYHAIAPPNQAASGQPGVRNLVFLGAMTNFQNFLRAEVSSLWAWAYLHHALDRDPSTLGRDGVMHQTALLGQWATLRYPLGNGKNMPDIMFDGLAYMDLLTNDLGLKRRRGVLGDIFGGMYHGYEWAGIIEEWKAKIGVSP